MLRIERMGGGGKYAMQSRDVPEQVLKQKRRAFGKGGEVRPVVRTFGVIRKADAAAKFRIARRRESRRNAAISGCLAKSPRVES